MSDARIGIILPANWWLAYLGKPWAAVPNPPESYTCGELVRAVHLDLCGIDSPPIPVTNAGSRAQCLRAMQPTLFGLEPLALTIEPRALDVVFLGRRERFGHCGVAVETTEGLRVLHCPEAACGVTLDSLLELRFAGFPNARWFRHRDMDAALRARGRMRDGAPGEGR